MRRRPNPWSRLCFCAVLAVSCLGLTGCFEDAAETKAALGDLQHAVAKMQTDLNALPEQSEQAKALAEKLGKAQAAIAALQENLDKRPADAIGVAEAALQTAGPFVPPPWNVLIPVGLNVLLLLRNWQNRSAARNIAAATEAAKMANGGATVDFAAPATMATMDLMGSAAKRLVDEAQGKKLKLPV